MIDEGKRNLLGVLVNVADYEAATGRIIVAAKANAPLAVSALAVHGVMTGVLDESHRHRLNCLDLVLPDGQPVRWALNLLHRSGLRDRVYGPKLTLWLCQKAAEECLPIYLYVSTPETLASLGDRLVLQFPGLKIARARPSMFRRITAEEKRHVIEDIRTSGAKILLVGLGCPRQEVWTYENRSSLPMPIVAVGAAFDFHAGSLRQAPEVLQRVGLEWAFRLCAEPKRLWRRYLLLNPHYVWLVFCQLAHLKRFDPDSAPIPAQELNYG